MPLFHYQKGFPLGVKLIPVFSLKHSTHAVEQSQEDRYGKFELPTVFRPSECKIIEIGMSDAGEIFKVLARKPYKRGFDIVFSVNPKERVVITAWLQRSNDLHLTVDLSRYDTPRK